ncbi:unnamed protein product [Acanthoscelides obtectus]|uniref:Uncharacterized protein n=1 Tax=Acanthoscelides obtectus TaxID=200917 RepID=A0A9P0PSD8_ACAOB|nr:unnamed protein product [Acanthoscelides obtectus]CAK1677464.1 hypothetical protein AOBTE_LOCUS31343 [Acanthoscelides obtectus]
MPVVKCAISSSCLTFGAVNWLSFSVSSTHSKISTSVNCSDVFSSIVEIFSIVSICCFICTRYKLNGIKCSGS